MGSVSISVDASPTQVWRIAKGGGGQGQKQLVDAPQWGPPTNSHLHHWDTLLPGKKKNLRHFHARISLSQLVAVASAAVNVWDQGTSVRKTSVIVLRGSGGGAAGFQRWREAGEKGIIMQHCALFCN